MIRAVLADDQALVRAGFAVLLDTEDGFEVVGQAADGHEAVAMARRLRPDVVVMDIRMPGLNGLEATREITADPELSGVRILVLTTFDVDEYVFDALRAGASGFLLKDVEPVDFLRALKVIAEGEALLGPTITRRLIADFVSRPGRRKPTNRDVSMLTEREREVLALVGSGMSNQAIADHLVISPATARTHVSRIITKLHARDRAQLVVLAYENELVSAGRP